jgi:energy-coupling factor transporter ATP-binding protein EcfA2
MCNDWQGDVHELILLSGPNGCGKSTSLRAVAHLWNLTGSWLSSTKASSRNPSRRWLERWGSVAVLIDDLPQVGSIGIFWGASEFLESLKSESGINQWIGETRNTIERSKYLRSLMRSKIHSKEPWFQNLHYLYLELILKNEAITPNVIHLDGEERRWIVPTKGLGEVVADDPELRWLVNYRATDQWKGQLESSLVALKTISLSKYERTLNDLNRFLSPKKILPDPDPNNLRLSVQLVKEGVHIVHSLDELSAGEHQILIQLYLISRWLQPGGVAMIDEPDLHLHPSLLSVFLSTLEGLVKERNGQLILTSHNPELWRRYENKGLRIQLGGEL